MATDRVVLCAGQEGAITAPAEAAQSTKQTGDLLRRFKEYATSVKEGMRAEPPALTDEETALRNEKIRVDDFQDKMIHASRKVGISVSWAQDRHHPILGLHCESAACSCCAHWAAECAVPCEQR